MPMPVNERTSQISEHAQFTPPGYGTRLAVPMWNTASSSVPNHSPPPSYESVFEMPTWTHQSASHFVTPLRADQQNNQAPMPEYNVPHVFLINNGSTNAQWSMGLLSHEHDFPSASMTNGPSSNHQRNIQVLSREYNTCSGYQRAQSPPPAPQWNIHPENVDYDDPPSLGQVMANNGAALHTVDSSQALMGFRTKYRIGRSRALGNLLIVIGIVQFGLAIALATRHKEDNRHFKTLSYGIAFSASIFYIFAASLLIAAWIEPCTSQTKVALLFGTITLTISCLGLAFNILDLIELTCYPADPFKRSYHKCEEPDSSTYAIFYTFIGTNMAVLLSSFLVACCRNTFLPFAS